MTGQVNFPVMSVCCQTWVRVEMKASARGSSQFLQVQRSLLLLIVFTVSLLTLVLSLQLSSITVKLPASPLSDEEEMELPAGWVLHLHRVNRNWCDLSALSLRRGVVGAVMERTRDVWLPTRTPWWEGSLSEVGLSGWTQQEWGWSAPSSSLTWQSWSSARAAPPRSSVSSWGGGAQWNTTGGGQRR